ncbi:MAG: hypothetical protein ABWY81_06080 [Jiangellaceae bacterium]
MARPIIRGCGTRAAYERHRRHGEVPDRECVDAHRAYQKLREPLRGKRLAERNRAKKLAAERLRDRHLKEFRILYAQALLEIRGDKDKDVDL